MGRPIDEGKWQAWRQRLARYERGGQTVAAFCAAEGVSTPSFYQWKRRLASAVGMGELTARRPAQPLPFERAEFLPVRIAAAGQVEIELPNGARVRVPCHDAGAISAAILAAGQLAAAADEEGAAC